MRVCVLYCADIRTDPHPTSVLEYSRINVRSACVRMMYLRVVVRMFVLELRINFNALQFVQHFV
jgi:hypothetical protein